MRNKLAFRISLGGIIASVCLLLMFCTNMFPMLDYTIPAFAGFLMVVMIVETSPKWSIVTYFVVSALCLIVTPNYEATMLFILFMGYYPILKFYLDRLKNKVLAWVIKFAVFNLALVLFYLVFTFLFTSVDLLEGMEMFGKYALLILWVMANVVFVVYDIVLGQLIDLYVNWFRKKILRRC
ncbi:MAG: hypothetical protein IJU04_02740 [Ruminococcus sp.]|nr:hypothetical protein [Ruminococcus sp.]